MLSDAIRCKMALVQLVQDYSDELHGLSLSLSDWQFIEELYAVLQPFNEHTKSVSQSQPRIATSTAVYFELQELFRKASRREGEYATYSNLITSAVHAGLEKFEKYYKFMDNTLIYFVASVLDPRIKGVWVQNQHENGPSILEKVRQFIHDVYPDNKPVLSLNTTTTPTSSIHLRMLKAIHKDKALVSDIDQYFDSPVVDWNGNMDPNWLLQW